MQPEVYREMMAVQATHWWFSARRRILARLIRGFGLGPQAEILEIGCGTGPNLATLAECGRLSAMEYEPQACAIAQALGVCQVRQGGLPEPVPYEDGRFDVVGLFDVLEHIADDRGALARAARLLRPGGRLVIAVPAYRWLWSAHDTAHHHLRRYTAPRLRATAQAAGLRVERIGYFNTLLFPMVALIRLVLRVTGRAEGSNATLPPAPLNSLLEAVFAAERHWLARWNLPFGVSVLAVLVRD